MVEIKSIIFSYSLGFVKSLGRVKKELRLTRYFTYLFMSIWKILAFFISTLLILYMKGETVGHLFSMLSDAFGKHKIEASQAVSSRITDIAEILESSDKIPIDADVHTPIFVLLLQIFSAYFMYIFGKTRIKKF